METIRLTKEANEKRRAQWLHQSREQRNDDMSAWKKSAVNRRNAKAQKRADREAAQEASRAAKVKHGA